MGLLKYFKAGKPEHATPVDTAINSQYTSQDQSCATSIHSDSTDAAVDVLKYKVMLNYLYQQQTTSGWRADRGNQSEGVILRLSRSNYLACPPEISESPLVAALNTLNVQVSVATMSSILKSDVDTGGHDCLFSRHQVLFTGTPELGERTSDERSSGPDRARG